MLAGTQRQKKRAARLYALGGMPASSAMLRATYCAMCRWWNSSPCRYMVFQPACTNGHVHGLSVKGGSMQWPGCSPVRT